MKRSDPSGRCFHFCHRRLPLPHKMLPSKPVAPARGGASAARAPVARRPGPVAEMRQPPSINIRRVLTRQRPDDRQRFGPRCRNFRPRGAFPFPGGRLRRRLANLGHPGLESPPGTAPSPVSSFSSSSRRSSQSVRNSMPRCGLLRAECASAVSASPRPSAASSSPGVIAPARTP
jgi:hypothetical protein